MVSSEEEIRLPLLKDLTRVFTPKSVSAGIVAALFGCSGPVLIVISAAEAGNLTSGQTVAWLSAIYFMGGLISLIMALRYRQPINGAYSMPGAAIMITALATIPYNEAVGAFIMSGAIVLALGVSGVVGRIMRWLPMPIVMAMIAGSLIRFGIGAVNAVGVAPLIAGTAMVTFFLVYRFVKSVPPVLAAALAGLGIAFAVGAIQPADVDIAFVAPRFTTPNFTFGAFLAISVPMAVLMIGAENAQATGVLMAEGYSPPVNAMTIISGIGSIAAGFLGGHNANIAGPMTAICASEHAGDDKTTRYGATLVNGMFFCVFGLFVGIAVPFILALPGALIGIVAGLAMLHVLLAAFQSAFSKRWGHQVGALAALVVALSSTNLLGVSAPFWALVSGIAVSILMGEKTPYTKPEKFSVSE